jgi:ribosomal protein S24E
MILEGFCNKLSLIGFSIERRKFITQAFDVKNPISLSLKELRLLKGCELRTVYLKDMLTNRLVFGIILDLKFKIEYERKVYSYKQIKNIISSKYGEPISREIIREIRVKTGDLTPSGKMNAQASKFRYENILTIMERVGDKIELPDGNEAIISLQPTSIVIEV